MGLLGRKYEFLASSVTRTHSCARIVVFPNSNTREGSLTVPGRLDCLSWLAFQLPSRQQHPPPHQHQSPHPLTKMNVQRFKACIQEMDRLLGLRVCKLAPNMALLECQILPKWARLYHRQQHLFPHLMTKQNVPRFTSCISEMDYLQGFRFCKLVNLPQHYGCVKFYTHGQRL